MRPGRYLLTAFFLLLAGAVLPFLMVIRVVESSFFLNFISYIASVSGLVLGILAIAMFVGESRRKEEDDWHDY